MSAVKIAINGFVFSVPLLVCMAFTHGRIKNSAILLDHLASFGNFRARGAVRWLRFCNFMRWHRGHSVSLVTAAREGPNGFVLLISELADRTFFTARLPKLLDFIGSFGFVS
jgi:hypothetical protein